MSDLSDPRVFFAAERTLLAWDRTSLSLMAFGFVIECFGLFVHIFLSGKSEPIQRSFSFWIGFAFIVLGAFIAFVAIAQFCTVLRILKPVEIPEGYRVNVGMYTNSVVVVLGIALIIYLSVQGLKL
ncbi:MAG: DUF202 domain-containing protein [Deltaproteobacteria bacterium]|nr:DUF202 domain-containing protein [Deltaproteobacteria bacterium]